MTRTNFSRNFGNSCGFRCLFRFLEKFWEFVLEDLRDYLCCVRWSSSALRRLPWLHQPQHPRRGMWGLCVCARCGFAWHARGLAPGEGAGSCAPVFVTGASHARAEAHERAAWSRSLHRRPPPVCLCQLAPGVVPDSLGAVSASGNSLLRRCSIGAAQRFTPLASNMAGGQPLHRRVTPFLSARAGVPRPAHHGLARPTHFPKFYSLRSG